MKTAELEKRPPKVVDPPCPTKQDRDFRAILIVACLAVLFTYLETKYISSFNILGILFDVPNEYLYCIYGFVAMVSWGFTEANHYMAGTVIGKYYGCGDYLNNTLYVIKFCICFIFFNVLMFIIIYFTIVALIVAVAIVSVLNDILKRAIE